MMQKSINFSNLDEVDTIKHLEIAHFIEWVKGIETADLGRLLAVLEESKKNITEQLGRADDDGLIVDRDWYWKASRAKASFTVKAIALQAELGARKRADRATFERSFILAAKSILDKDIYTELIETAHGFGLALDEQKIGDDNDKG